MEFLLLGPLEVRGLDQTLRIASRRQRSLLAALLLRRNTIVGVDELIDALWQVPPENARASLLNHVSRLRLTLGPGVVETIAPGYRLRSRPRDVDLDRFQALVGRARAVDDDPHARARLFRQAEALWRGDLLTDVELSGPLALFAQTIGELRLEALEERLEAELMLGRHLELAAELERLVAQHPHRERLVEQLMLALYRSGRQADALGAFRTARRRLVEELGLDPGEALVRLERAILTHDLPLSPSTRRDAPLSLLTKTIELAPGTYVEKADFGYRLGVALQLMGEGDLAQTALAEARDRAALAGAEHVALRAQLDLDLTRLYHEGAPHTTRLEVADRAAVALERAEDDFGLALALRARGLIKRDLGRIEDALADFRRAATRSRQAVGTSWPTGTILTHEAESLALGPTPSAEAIARCHEILDAIPWGPPGPWGLYCSLGVLCAMRGEMAAGRAYVTRAAIACEEYDLAGRAEWLSLWQAQVEELAGDYDAAETVLRAARDELTAATGGAVAARHARVLAQLGRAEEALKAANTARSVPKDDPSTQAQRLRARALANTDPRRAVRLAEKAVRTLAATDLISATGDAWLDLATVQARAHLPDRARTSAATARELFKRKGHLVGTERASRFDPTRAWDSGLTAVVRSDRAGGR